jgi:hypothetical protein
MRKLKTYRFTAILIQKVETYVTAENEEEAFDLAIDDTDRWTHVGVPAIEEIEILEQLTLGESDENA